MKPERTNPQISARAAAAATTLLLLLVVACSPKPPTPIQAKMREIDKIFQFTLGRLGEQDFTALRGQGAQMAALVESETIRGAAPHASDPSWVEYVGSFARECRNLELAVAENVVGEILVSWDGVKQTCQSCHRHYKVRKR